METETVVKWYGQEIMAKFEKASADAIKRMAFECEAKTKDRITANGQVDTGFMRNSVYTVTVDGSSGGVASTAFQNAAGQTVKRESVSLPSVTGQDVAICGVGAVYAVYQEVKNPFLRPSFDQVIEGAEAIVTGAFGELFDG